MWRASRRERTAPRGNGPARPRSRSELGPRQPHHGQLRDRIPHRVSPKLEGIRRGVVRSGDRGHRAPEPGVADRPLDALVEIRPARRWDRRTGSRASRDRERSRRASPGSPGLPRRGGFGSGSGGSPCGPRRRSRRRPSPGSRPRSASSIALSGSANASADIKPGDLLVAAAGIQTAEAAKAGKTAAPLCRAGVRRGSEVPVHVEGRDLGLRGTHPGAGRARAASRVPTAAVVRKTVAGSPCRLRIGKAFS